MKKILKYSLLAVLGFVLAANTGCKKSELDTDQFNGFSVAAIAPNPVMRGAELRIIGGGLENATEVKFAGGVSVSNIQVVEKGSRSEIRVLVPLEGPEVGKVTVVGNDGRTASTRFDLSFTEPISIDSFSPDYAVSGQTLTFQGEYLNDVKTVIFAGDVMVNEFVSQSRHELSVKVPFNALTGPVILSDVDELNDDSSIPNHIYTATELEIGYPTVDMEEPATYKAGDLIVVTGAHLDMIERLDLPGVDDVPFELSEGADKISFTLPAAATDGNIILTSYAGDSFIGGLIETVTVADLGITSLAKDGRFKAGAEVQITGSDLDLVEKVAFGGGVEASFYYSDGSLFTSVPDTAKDGAVTVTLGSGKQASTGEIEVVKPEILAWESVIDALVAGESTLRIEGLDLDLVTSAKIGNKEQGFIDCVYYLDVDDLGFSDIVVEIPRAAYTAPIILTSAAGYETETFDVAITYNEAVSINFDAPSFAMGKNVSLTGTNLMNIESVYVKGIKVSNFSVRTDDVMAFALPDGVGPGVYRLQLGLYDGTEITWPVPFAVTAPYTETFIFEGYEDLGSWSNQPYFGADGAFAELGMVVGDQVRIYYTPKAEWWQFQIFSGHWEGMTFPELGGSNTVSKDNSDPDATFFTFEVTNDNIGVLTASQGWGGALLTQGENVVITGVSLIHFGATETVIWEGPSAHTGDYALNLELGGEDDWVNAELTEGSEIRIYFTPDDPNDWSLQVFDGHWGGMGYVTPNGVQWNNENAPEAIEKGYVSFKAEGAAFTALTTHAWWGFALIVQGKNLVVNKLAFQ